MASRWAEFLGENYLETHGHFVPICNWLLGFHYALAERGIDFYTANIWDWDWVGRGTNIFSKLRQCIELALNIGEKKLIALDPEMPLDTSNYDRNMNECNDSIDTFTAGIELNALDITKASQLAGYDSFVPQLGSFDVITAEWLWQCKRMLDACRTYGVLAETALMRDDGIYDIWQWSNDSHKEWWSKTWFHYSHRTFRCMYSYSWEMSLTGYKDRADVQFEYYTPWADTFSNITNRPELCASLDIKIPMYNPVACMGEDWIQRIAFWHPSGNDLMWLPVTIPSSPVNVLGDLGAWGIGVGNDPLPSANESAALPFRPPAWSGWGAHACFAIADFGVPGGFEFYDPLD